MTQERIPEYVAMLKAKETKNISDYETPARVCAEYFDGRGIDTPTADDWTAFAEYFSHKYEQEKGKRPSDYTVSVNYVSRGKTFYRWCASQDGSEQTASLFAEDKTEAIYTPETEAEKPRQTEASAKNHERAEAETKEADKPAENVRVNFLLSKGNHEALLSLVYLKGQTLTAILKEAIEAYIQGYSEEIAKLEETRRKFRSK